MWLGFAFSFKINLCSQIFSHIPENIHLFTGTILSGGLALLKSGTSIYLALYGAVSVIENIFIFLPAASAPDYCFRMILPKKRLL